MPDTLGYARVSTVGQSLEVQREELLKAGCTPKLIYEEKASGSSTKRPQLENLIRSCRAGDKVVVTRLDRLARNTKHLLEIVERLEEEGASLSILNINLDTSTATGKLMLTLLGGIAEFERELMLERQAEGIAKAKAAGKYTGRQPTARAKAPEVIRMASEGSTKQAIADGLGISLASVFRILKDHREGKQVA